MSEILSPHNQNYKRWRKYVAKPESDSCPWIPVEGWKQVTELASRRSLETLVFCSDTNSAPERLIHSADCTFRVSEALFRGLSEVQTTQGVLGFFRKPSWSWSDLTAHILYLDRLQDPGNLGTLLRTAAATGIFSVITGPETVSCYKSKVVRASAAYLFSVPFLQNVALTEIQNRGYELWLTDPADGISLFEAALKPPLALIVGNESSGPSVLTEKTPVRSLRIPMSAGIDSLNAAVAGSLVMYETVRRTSVNG
jgi:TrmH family RNA methyltransferase